MPKKSINGIELSWEEAGSGLPLMLLHPFPVNQSVWAGQRRALAGHARVITPDLRGFGDSTFNGTETTMEQFADDVHALMTELKINRVVLGGLSMGGYVALAFYRKYPWRVRGLILASTKPQADSDEDRQARQELAALAKERGSGAVGTPLLPKLFGEYTFRVNPHLPLHIWRKIKATPPETIVAASLAMAARQDSLDLLSKVHCPTLVLVGVQDSLAPPPVAEYMARQIPNATLTVIPNSGHMSNLEQPEAFNNAVRDFLTNLQQQKHKEDPPREEPSQTPS